MTSTKFVTAYGPHLKKGISEWEPSKTKQSFKDETDINLILERFRDQGITPVVNPSASQYGDFSNVDDYQSALNSVMNANNAFSSLPANIRARFENEPANLLAFLQDDRNRDEAITLGFIEKPSVEAYNASQVSPEPVPASKKKLSSNASDES